MSYRIVNHEENHQKQKAAKNVFEGGSHVLATTSSKLGVSLAKRLRSPASVHAVQNHYEVPASISSLRHGSPTHNNVVAHNPHAPR